MPIKKKSTKTKKTETNTEWLDKVINQLTNKDFYNYLQIFILIKKLSELD